MFMYSLHFRKMHEVLSSVERMGKGKGNSDDDKHFRHLVRRSLRSGFRLLDFCA